ncbi:MAG TPA: protein-disulfide reductase DsbD domain-containing protein [Tepidisphaeraceae bacterium]|jgi:DsbC/DsbD-like thiol-disulfide interchange protein|nr:protein-disulfide reductase DsbD domain-containing protein [Tepidisphaeraceae bacterium]
MKRAIFPCFVGLWFIAFACVARGSDLVSAEMLSDVSAIAPGKAFNVGVKLKIAPGWHVYWVNAGDTGIPTKITFTLPDGFTAGAVQYPVPQRIDVTGGMVSYGYSDEVLLMATITPPTNLKVGTSITIGAKASWLVCKENCIKGDAKLEQAFKVAAVPLADGYAEFAKWQAQLPQATDRVKQDVQLDAAGGQFKSASGKLIIKWDKAPDKVEWFPDATDQMIVSTNELKTENGQSTVTFKIDALPGEKVSDAVFNSVLAYTLDGRRVGLAVPIRLNSSNQSQGH